LSGSKIERRILKMNRAEIQRAEDELKAKKEEVITALAKAKKEKEQADARIKEIDALLSGLLADISLKKIPNSKGMKQLVTLKREKARQSRVIETYGYLKPGLEAELKKYSPHCFEVLLRKKDLWNGYEKVKAEISANPRDRHHDLREAKLLRLATHPDLDCVEDAKAFLRKLKEDQTPKD